jgi:hypothetical protein
LHDSINKEKSASTTITSVSSVEVKYKEELVSAKVAPSITVLVKNQEELENAKSASDNSDADGNGSNRSATTVESAISPSTPSVSPVRPDFAQPVSLKKPGLGIVSENVENRKNVNIEVDAGERGSPLEKLERLSVRKVFRLFSNIFQLKFSLIIYFPLFS